MHLRSIVMCAAIMAVLFLSVPASAQPWMDFDSQARYIALGDSISAGYGVHPATQAYPYQLYHSGVIADLNDTLFATMAVPGALSSDVLKYQAPQVPRFLHDTGCAHREVVTLMIGGNDLFQIIDGAPAPDVLNTFAANLSGILQALTSAAPDAEIYVGTLYDPRLPVPGEKDLILAANQIITQVVLGFQAMALRVYLVDLYSAFEGRSGLLLLEKHGSGPTQAHPTIAGQGVIAEAFAAAIRRK